MWKKLLKLFLFILIVVVAIYFPAIMLWVGEALAAWGLAIPAALSTSIASMPLWVGGVVALGASYLIAPETTSELVDDVAEGAGKVVDAVVDVAAGAVGSVASSFAPWLIGLGAAYLVFFRKKSNDSQTVVMSDGAGAAVREAQ